MSTTTTTAGIASAGPPSVEIVAMSRSSSPELDPVAVSEDLTPLPSLKQAGDSDIDFDGQLDRPLKVREDVRSGCGGQTWPAGLVLGKHMLRYHREELQDARMYVSQHHRSDRSEPTPSRLDAASPVPLVQHHAGSQRNVEPIC